MLLQQVLNAQDWSELWGCVQKNMVVIETQEVTRVERHTQPCILCTPINAMYPLCVCVCPQMVMINNNSYSHHIN